MKDFFFLGVTTIAEEDLIQTVLETMAGLIMADLTMADLITVDSTTTMGDSTMVDSTMVDLITTMVDSTTADLTTTMEDSTMADLTTTMADSITTMADWMLDAAVNADLIYFLSQMGVFKETVELLIVQVKKP